MQIERTLAPVFIGILGFLITISIISVFPTFLSTTLEKHSLPFSAVLLSFLALLWVFVSGTYWWLAFPLMASWGGLFWIGFKIYPSELGVLIAAAALTVALFKDHQAMVQHRSPLSWSFLLLALYLFVHMSTSLYISGVGLLAGGGSIIRVYAGGFTFILFSWMYYTYGTSEHIKLTIIIMFIITLLRIAISIIQLYTPLFSDIYSTSFALFNSTLDLRFSAFFQILLSIVLFYIFKQRLVKGFILIFIISLFILVLFGEGRASASMAISSVILWLLLAKRFRLLICLIPLFILFIVIVYGELDSFSRLPLPVQRALSFIPGLKYELIHNTELSNRWHFDLMASAFQRWTSSFASLIFGNCIDAVGVYSFDNLDYFSQLQIAAATARYESTLWTILAGLGIVGMALYVCIFTFLFREIIPLVKSEGIISFNHAVYAVATISFLQLLLYSWICGGFPSIELMFGVMAKALYEDNMHERFT